MRIEVVINRDSNGTSEVVEKKDILNVKLAEEPTMIHGPLSHVRVTGEQRFHS